MTHQADVHRCLATGDVAGLLHAWAMSHPHLAGLSPPEALIALHMARVEARSIPLNLKLYSAAFLLERGYRRIDGKWVEGLPKEAEIVGAAGIASRSADPRTATRIVRAMGDAYLDAVAAGIDEPPMQRERMLKARARTRFRMRID
jgi:hypothetical protein